MISTRQTFNSDELLNAVKKVRSKGAGVTGYCPNNWNLLLLAAEYGHLDIVKYLLDKERSC